MYRQTLAAPARLPWPPGPSLGALSPAVPPLLSDRSPRFTTPPPTAALDRAGTGSFSVIRPRLRSKLSSDFPSSSEKNPKPLWWPTDPLTTYPKFLSDRFACPSLVHCAAASPASSLFLKHTRHSPASGSCPCLKRPSSESCVDGPQVPSPCLSQLLNEVSLSGHPMPLYSSRTINPSNTL